MNHPIALTLTTILAVAGTLAAARMFRILLRAWRNNEADDAVGRDHSARFRFAPLAALMAMGTPMLVVTGAHGQSAEQSSTPEIRTTASLRAETAAETPSDAPASAFSVQLNFDYTTAYFYHGIIQEDTGLIFQPAGRVTMNIFEQHDLRLGSFVGIWNSFHGQKTGADTRSDFTDYWYEADLYAGLTLTTGPLAFTANYIFLTSPSDAYETVQELDLTLAFDDTEWLKEFAMHPYALVGIETGADASDGADSDSGVYLELGVAPGFSFDVGKTAITMSFPLSVGLSLKDYYQDGSGDDEMFGYVQAGAKASIPLPFADRYGKWSINAGLYGLFLGDNPSDYNAGDDFEVIATLGLQVNF